MEKGNATIRQSAYVRTSNNNINYNSRIRSSRLVIEEFFDGFKQRKTRAVRNKVEEPNPKVPQSIFLGALCLKPVPNIFQVTLQPIRTRAAFYNVNKPIEINQKPNILKLFNNNKNEDSDVDFAVARLRRNKVQVETMNCKTSREAPIEMDDDEIEDYLEIDQNVVEDLQALIPEEEINNIIIDATTTKTEPQKADNETVELVKLDASSRKRKKRKVRKSKKLRSNTRSSTKENKNENIPKSKIENVPETETDNFPQAKSENIPETKILRSTRRIREKNEKTPKPSPTMNAKEEEAEKQEKKISNTSSRTKQSRLKRKIVPSAPNKKLQTVVKKQKRVMPLPTKVNDENEMKPKKKVQTKTTTKSRKRSLKLRRKKKQQPPPSPTTVKTSVKQQEQLQIQVDAEITNNNEIVLPKPKEEGKDLHDIRPEILHNTRESKGIVNNSTENVIMPEKCQDDNTKNMQENQKCNITESNPRSVEHEPYRRIYKCRVCLKIFETYNRLKAHKRVHEVKNPYQCQECGNSYDDVEELAAHLRIHKGKKSYKRKNEETIQMKIAEIKKKLSNTIRKEQMGAGQKITRSRSRNIIEIKSEPTAEIEESEPEPEENYETEETLEDEQVESNNVEQNNSANNSSEIYEFSEETDADQNVGAIEESDFIVEHETYGESKKGKKRKGSKKNDVKIIKVKRDNLPPLILKTVKKKTLLLGKMPYPCKKCDESFWTTVQLERHQMVHVLKKVPPANTSAPRKVFKCEVCNKEFKKICDLERHTRVHTGEKPSVCNICNKRFQQAYNLNKHLLIHTQEKNFECVICQKKFGRNDVLNRHVLTHSIDKPFHCSICSKTFIRNTQLNLHLKKHHGLKDETQTNDANNKKANEAASTADVAGKSSD